MCGVPVPFILACFSGRTWTGLARGADSVTLPPSFGGKGPHLKQWLVALLCVPLRFPNWGFPRFSSVVRQMPGNLLHCPRCTPHSVITLIIFLSATDRLDRLTDLGQMAYHAGNPSLQPKPVRVAAASGRRRLYWADIHTSRKREWGFQRPLVPNGVIFLTCPVQG